MKIGVYLEGNTWGAVGPEALAKGMGGRESAAVYLAECWADLGHEVHVFCPASDPASYRRDNGGVSTYLHHDMALPMMTSFHYDAILSWEAPEIFGLEQVRDNCPALLCGLQVAHFMCEPEAIAEVDCWVALSPWHAKFMEWQAPRTMRRVEVLPNCVDLKKFPARDPHAPVAAAGVMQFAYTSSPDRGLIHVLEAWPRLREEFPGCVLHVAYGLKRWTDMVYWGHGQASEISVDVVRLMQQDGIIDHGQIGHAEVASLHSTADALLYPCDPAGPTETGCITVMEACAGGNIPIITNADCLESEFGSVAEIVNLPWDEEAYVRQVVATMTDPARIAELRIAGREFAEQRQWPIVAAQWLKLFADVAASQTEPAVAPC